MNRKRRLRRSFNRRRSRPYRKPWPLVFRATKVLYYPEGAPFLRNVLQRHGPQNHP